MVQFNKLRSPGEPNGNHLETCNVLDGKLPYIAGTSWDGQQSGCDACASGSPVKH